jgi:hypothetical protein
MAGYTAPSGRVLEQRKAVLSAWRQAFPSAAPHTPYTTRQHRGLPKRDFFEKTFNFLTLKLSKGFKKHFFQNLKNFAILAGAPQKMHGKWATRKDEKPRHSKKLSRVTGE